MKFVFNIAFDDFNKKIKNVFTLIMQSSDTKSEWMVNII